MLTQVVKKAATPLCAAASRCYGASRVVRAPAPENVALFVCDLQDTFLPHIAPMPRVVKTTKAMMRIAKVLGMPISVTEQLPFKPTVEELRALYTPGPDGAAPELEVAFSTKSTFSMVKEPEMAARLLPARASAVIMTGIEGHVCIAQTTRDLLAADKDVYLLVDAIASTNAHACAVALQQLQHAGAVLTTTEDLVFELMGSAKHSGFKDVIKIIKELKRELAELDKPTETVTAKL